MTRVWSSGFELQSTADYVEFLPVIGTGTHGINTTIKRSGAASWRLNPSSDYAILQHQFRASGTSKVFFRAYVYISTLPDTSFSIMGLGIADQDATGAEITLNPDGTLELRYYNAGYTQIGSDSDPLSTGQWYRLEISYDDDTNEAEGKIDGVTFASGSSTDLGGFTHIGIGSFYTSFTGDLYFDDIAINDTTGTAQTSWPGAGSIVHMQPNAAGDNNNASSGDYSSIDEVTPDDATTIAILNDNGDILDVNMETSANAGIGASDTITLVQVGSRDAIASAAAAAYVQRVKSQASGTVLEGTSVTHNDTTYKTAGMGEGNLYGYQLTSYVDPQAGGAWTPSLLDSAQIGVRATDADPDINLTTLWALVEYVPAVASAGIRSMRQLIGHGQGTRD